MSRERAAASPISKGIAPGNVSAVLLAVWTPIRPRFHPLGSQNRAANHQDRPIGRGEALPGTLYPREDCDFPEAEARGARLWLLGARDLRSPPPGMSATSRPQSFLPDVFKRGLLPQRLHPEIELLHQLGRAIFGKVVDKPAHIVSRRRLFAEALTHLRPGQTLGR
jgi:hypothetical protein